MSEEPIDRRLHRWMVEVSEPREQADGVARETNLALPTSQIPRRTAKPTEEQLHGLHDSRVSPPDSKIGEDEEAPVRRDVFRAVQLSRGVAGGVPLASGMLELEDLRRPSFPTDLLDRKSTRLNSSHGYISYAVFCLKKKKTKHIYTHHEWH